MSLSLDVSEALEVLSDNGPLSRLLTGYESRLQQKGMLRDVIHAMNQNNIALIEAGTGTGKSVAYLLPAVLRALKWNERTVIATNTINLQEQLLLKDIPILLKALNVQLKSVLVKGMTNYICKRKIAESRQELPLFTPVEAEEWERFEAWSQSTQDGSRSTLPFAPSGALWEKVGAEHDTCNKRECPHFKDCFYFKARKQAEEAKILIINHHLLCCDLVSRQEGEGLLPDYQKVILDEAHNLEDIATDFFAARFSQLGFLRNLSRLASEKQDKVHGKLPLLKTLLQNHYRNGLPEDQKSILTRLNLDLPHLRQEISTALIAMGESFRQFCTLLQKSDEEEEKRLRIRKLQLTHPRWGQEIIPNTKSFLECTYRYIQMLAMLDLDILRLKNESFKELVKGLLHEIRALANRLNDSCTVLKKFIGDLPENKVRWIEIQQFRSGSNVLLWDADLNVAEDLAKNLFNQFDSTTLVSATLTTNQQFDFIRSRLGLTDEFLKGKRVIQNRYDSPFNYLEQTLLAIPTDMPSPSDFQFQKAAAERIWQAVQASRGNAFVLFTSYNLLKVCYDLLVEKLKEMRFNVLKQGDTNRQALLNQFKSVDKSILFGTDSFWEGVDVAGEALRCVIIVKLPFKVPSEPIIQARSELIAAKGGDPFYEYSLPMAVVKFKQGFGRLIRNRRDRGCIVCLDNRIITKTYGQHFLNSLPTCQQVFADSSQVYQAMVEFYRKTSHFTKLP